MSSAAMAGSLEIFSESVIKLVVGAIAAAILYPFAGLARCARCRLKKNQRVVWNV